MTDVLKGHSLVWKETALYARACRGSKYLRLMYLVVIELNNFLKVGDLQSGPGETRSY